MSLFSRTSSESSRHENDGPSARGGSAFGGLPSQGLRSGEVKARPSAIPAEAGIHCTSVFLSEAFMDSSFFRTRDALPEQYRETFDELRSGILAFCKEFQIPVESLSNTETFEAALRSKNILPKRMAEVVLLFERLEYLIANKEPLEVESEALKEVEPLYHLTEQYNNQVSLLERAGILEEGAIIGIDGNKYPIPTLEQIAQRLFEREKDLSTKRDQGFTKLLLVPFGMSLDALRETLKQFLLFYKQKYPAFDLDINKPLDTLEEWYKGADTEDPSKIVYNPHSFDDHHQGQTKADILEAQTDNPGDSFPGWRVHLFQPSDPANLHSPGFASIPRQGQGHTHGEELPRPSLGAGKSLIEYFSLLEEARDDPTSPYHSEFGLTPEDWVLAFMTHLEETGKPLDNYQNWAESTSYLIGAYFLSSALVPFAYWDRGFQQARLAGFDSSSRGTNAGLRSSVIV